MLNSIKSKGGFVEFLHTVYDMDFDSGWQAQSYMMIDIASHELQYLIYDVFDFGSISSDNFGTNGNAGIRPVITISTSDIK